MTRLWLASSNRYAEAFKIWKNSTLHLRQESRKRDTLKVFEILKAGLRGNLSLLYTNSMENKQKAQAIRRFMKMNKVGLASALSQWRRNVSLKGAHDHVIAEKNKSSGQTLTLALTGTYQNNLRQAFNAIKREFEASKVKRKAMVSLVRSLTSKRRHAFNAWRIFSIQNKDQGRVILLESLLRRLTNKALKGGFEALKGVVREVEDQKKRHLLHMVYMIQRKQKKALDLWAGNVKENSHVMACRATIKLVEIINQALNQNISQLLSTNKRAPAKLNALRRLVDATKGKLKWGMDRWKKNMEIEKYKGLVETEKKTYMVKNLEGLLKRKQKAQLKDAFGALKDLENEEKLKRKVISMAFKADSARLRQAWDRWLAAPSKRAIKRQQTMNGVGLLMYNLIKNRKKEAFECIKQERQNMLEAKKDCLRRIFSSTVDKQKDCFNIWAQNMRAERQILRCKEAIGLFKTLNGILKQQLAYVLVNDKDFEKKKIAIRKLQGNTNGRLKEAMDKWRSFMVLQKLGKDLAAQKRLMSAVKIQEILVNVNNNALKDALAVLKENRREVKTKKRFINALYKTRIGSLHRAFEKWKALPTKAELQKQGNVNTLQQKLEKLQFIFKRTAFDALREPAIQAAQLKRDCIKTMIFLTSDKRKLAFKAWAKKTKDLKHIEASRGAIVIFETLAKTLKGNLDLLMQDAGITKRKEKALRSLLVFSRFKKADAFRTWRTAAEMALWYDETINPTKYTTRTNRSQGDNTFEPYSESEERDYQEDEIYIGDEGEGDGVYPESNRSLTDRNRKSGILKPERIGTPREGGRDDAWDEPEFYKGEIVGEDQQDERAKRVPKQRFAAATTQQGGAPVEWSSIGEQSPLGSLSSRRADETEPEAYEGAFTKKSSVILRDNRPGRVTSRGDLDEREQSPGDSLSSRRAGEEGVGKKTSTGVAKGARVTSRGDLDEREESPVESLSSRRTGEESVGKKTSTGVIKGAKVTSRGNLDEREQSPVASQSSRRAGDEGVGKKTSTGISKGADNQEREQSPGGSLSSRKTGDEGVGKKASTGILKGARVTSRGNLDEREQSPVGSLSSRRTGEPTEGHEGKKTSTGILKGTRVTSRGDLDEREQSPVASLSSSRRTGEEGAGKKVSLGRGEQSPAASSERRVGEFDEVIEEQGERKRVGPSVSTRGKKAVSIGEIEDREQSPVGSPSERREESKGEDRKIGPTGILRGSMSNRAGGETVWEDFDEKGGRSSPSHYKGGKKGVPQDTERNVFDDLLTTDRSANASIGGGTTMHKSARGVKFEGLEGPEKKGPGSLKEIAEEKGRLSTPERMRRAQTMKNAAMKAAVEASASSQGKSVGPPLNMEGLQAVEEKPHKSMRSAFRAVGRAQTQRNMIVWAARSLRSTLTKLKYDALIRWRNYAKQGPQRAKIGRLLFGLIEHQKEKGLREAFGKIRKQVETRREKKKLGLEKLVGRYVDMQKEAFQKWAGILNKEKQMKTCNSVYQVFNIINSALLNNTKTIYTPSFRSDKLRDIMRKLISSQKSKQKEAYWRWHDFSVQDRLIEASNSHIKAKNALEIAKLLDNKYKEILNDSFSRFKKIVSDQNLQRRALLQIIRATNHRQAFYFHKLRWIAVLKRSEQTYNIAHVLRTLENLVNNRKRGVLNALAGHSQDIQAKKDILLHSCLHKMIRPVHRAFALWKHNNSLIRQASIMNSTRQILDILAQKQRENTFPLYFSKGSVDIPAKTNHFERILRQLVSQRQRSFFGNLKQTLQNQDQLRKTLIHWANSQTKTDLQRAFATWKALLSEHRQSESNKGAFKIFQMLSQALQLSTQPIFVNDKSLQYKKQMIAKMLLLTTRARQAALFKQWKDSAKNESSLENVLKFSKAITLCSTSRKSGLREALLRWNRACHTQEAIQNLQSKAENEILAMKLSKSASLLAQILSHLLKNTTRKAFYALRAENQQRLKNAEILSRTLHHVVRGKLRDLFKEFKTGLWTKQVQESQDFSKVSSGFTHTQGTLNKIERKALASAFHHITLHILRRRKLMSIPQIISRLVTRRQAQIFHMLKLCLFADREKYQELKIKTFVNHLKNYQNNLIRGSISSIKWALLEKRRRDLIKKNLAVIWMNHRVRPAMKQWKLKSRLSDQIHAAKFQNMLNLLMKSNQHVMRRALIKWSFRRGKNVIEILSLILKRIVNITQKEAFDEILNKVKLMRVRDRILAVQQMMKFSQVYEQSRIYRAYHLWHKNAHHYNPWFKKAAALAAKNTPINFQIAFWRLRDATQVAGSNLTASQIIQCKKIFNFIKVLYERTVGKGFWMIERTSRGGGASGFTPTVSMENLDRTRRSSDVVERRRTLEKKQDEQFTKKQIATFALRRILRRLEDQNNRVKQGFRRWKLLTNGGRTALVKRAIGPMRNYEVQFVTKVGAVNIMYSHLKAHWLRTLKGSYDQIINYSQIVRK